MKTVINVSLITFMLSTCRNHTLDFLIIWNIKINFIYLKKWVAFTQHLSFLMWITGLIEVFILNGRGVNELRHVKCLEQCLAHIMENTVLALLVSLLLSKSTGSSQGMFEIFFFVSSHCWDFRNKLRLSPHVVGVTAKERRPVSDRRSVVYWTGLLPINFFGPLALHPA